MFYCQKQGRVSSIRVADDHDLAKAKRVNKSSKVFSINHSGVARPRRIFIGIVVAPAVSNRTIVFGKCADLICPVAAITQRSVNKDHRRSLALFHIMQDDAMANIGSSDLWRGGGRLSYCRNREQGKKD